MVFQELPVIWKRFFHLSLLLTDRTRRGSCQCPRRSVIWKAYEHYFLYIHIIFLCIFLLYNYKNYLGLLNFYWQKKLIFEVLFKFYNFDWKNGSKRLFFNFVYEVAHFIAINKSRLFILHQNFQNSIQQPTPAWISNRRRIFRLAQSPPRVLFRPSTVPVEVVIT